MFGVGRCDTAVWKASHPSNEKTNAKTHDFAVQGKPVNEATQRRNCDRRRTHWRGGICRQSAHSGGRRDRLELQKQVTDELVEKLHAAGEEGETDRARAEMESRSRTPEGVHLVAWDPKTPPSPTPSGRS